MILLENSPNFVLWQDATCACLYATWSGKHSSSETRVQYNLIRQHLRQTKSTKLLNDSVHDEDGWSQVTDWLADEGFGQLADEGLQVVAWVLPRQPAALYDTARVLARLRQPLVDTFTDAQAAYDWLHRWPAASFPLPAGEACLTAAAFLLLPPARQVTLVQQQGRALAPRLEADYYVKPYELLDVLRVEVYYYLHSGVFYQVRAQVAP